MADGCKFKFGGWGLGVGGWGFGVNGLWFATLTLDADAAHAGPG